MTEVDIKQLLAEGEHISSSDKTSDKDKSSDKLSVKQLAILEYIKEHPAATQQELADNIEGLTYARQNTK